MLGSEADGDVEAELEGSDEVVVAEAVDEVVPAGLGSDDDENDDDDSAGIGARVTGANGALFK